MPFILDFEKTDHLHPLDIKIIKESLLPVIFTTLQFSDTEIKIVTENIPKKGEDGFFTKLWKN